MHKYPELRDGKVKLFENDLLKYMTIFVATAKEKMLQKYL